MDWLTFITELTKALAWPMATVAIALLFRVQLQALFDRIKKGKVGPAEFEFEQRLAELSQEAAIGTSKTAKEEPSPSLIAEAKANPRGAIVAAWLIVENAARELVLKKDLLSEKLAMNPVSVMMALKQKEALGLEDLARLNALRELRNRATHDLDFSPSSASVIEYVTLATDMAAVLRAEGYGDA